MIRSNLVDLFLSSAWYLHGPIYDRLSGLLQAHLLENKDAWRRSMEDDTEDAPAPDCESESEVDELIGDVALIEVRGVLAMHADMVNGSCMPRGRSYESIIEQLAVAVADPAVKQIVLRLETPGGHAPGCQECYDAIKAADAIKPVHAFLTGYCFSAGIYLASGCRSITVVSATTEIGSIGTVWSTWDTSGQAEQAGLRKVVIRAGAYKALIQDGEPVSDIAIAEEQRIIDAFGAAFHDAVRAGRGLDDQQAEAVCNGRSWLAGEAETLGLVDAISTFPAFIAGITGPEPAMFFGKKKTTAKAAAPAPAGDPSATPTQPAPDAAPCDTVTQAVSAAIPKESTMDPKLMAALAALSDIHPTQAHLLIREANKPGATADGLHAFASATAIKVKDEQLAAVQTKLDTEAKSHSETKEKLAKLQKDHDELKALKDGSKDPGEGAPAGASAGKTMDPIAFAALSLAQQGEFLEQGGKIEE